MRLHWSGMVLCLAGLALCTAAAGATASTPAATPSIFPPGITFEPLAATPPGLHGLPGPQGPGTMVEVLARITYAPGAVFDFHAPGPIHYYIEQGTLTVQINPGHTGLMIPGRGSIGPFGATFRRNEPNTVLAGQGIYADDGYIGTTSNAGQLPVVALVTYFYSPHLNGTRHHMTATVAPSVSTPMP